MALRCPREFHYRYVEKVEPPEDAPEARIGKAVHTTLEKALQGTPIPAALLEGRGALEEENEQERFDTICEAGVGPFMARISDFRSRRRVQRELVEYTAAVREDFTVTQFYAGDAYFRGIFDVGYLYDDNAMAIIDHKTGVRHTFRSTIDQLEGYACLAAASFRNVRRFWLGIHWVTAGDIDWRRPLTRDQVRRTLLPRVMDNIEAAALAVDDGPRPNTSAWCARCSYRSICPAAQEALYDPVEPEIDPWD
jgi:CRISPR/Cas system-associated exonuclease Cas4 (RecB family)